MMIQGGGGKVVVWCWYRQILDGSFSAGWLAGKPDYPRLYQSQIVQVNMRWNQDLFEKKIEKKGTWMKKIRQRLKKESMIESSRRDLQKALLCTVL